MPDEKLIDQMIAIEWEMFHAVNDGGPKADCQNDPQTFDGMRRGQFRSWSQEASESYFEDLKNAKAAGRNLPMEKYIHMMKNTDPRGYEALAGRLTMPDEEGKKLADEITRIMIEQTAVLHRQYPYVSGSGRPLYSNQDFSGTTSIETYQRGELYTYSTKTLKLLYEHVKALEAKGESFARLVLENSVKYYGYKTLDDAEERTKKYVESLPIEVSFGCGCCDNDAC